jgi:predicted glycosyltransferase
MNKNITDNTKTTPSFPAKQQKRIIFFVFDGGYGVGHLRRLTRIAKELQGPFSCLIITGHRTVAHWFTPEECEYVHLPSWDSLIAAKSQYWGRKPFVEMNEKEAIKLRKEIIKGIIKGYKPDAIFVDHIPLGKEEELAEVIKNTKVKKYYVTRGFLNETENIQKLILGGKAKEYLEKYYDRIFVACDEKICNFGQKYNLSQTLQEKITYTGYVVEKPSADQLLKIRNERGLKSDDIWIVCSAGGGQIGEKLIKKCIGLSSTFKNVFFDIILGPRSCIVWEEITSTYMDRENVRLHKESTYLPLLHASADIFVSTGGYNSLLEALQGNPLIICCPARENHQDEQYTHASHLSPYININITTDLEDLKAALEDKIALVRKREKRDLRDGLNFMGAKNIKKILCDDFCIN